MNIIVTGASRGIGFELARLLSVREGHSVLAIARDQGKLEKLKASCRLESQDCRIFTMPYDLTDLSSVEDKLPAQIGRIFDSLDILVNNAGLLIKKPIPDISADDLRSMMDINFLAPLFLVRSLLGLLKKGQDPHVVNIGSMSGMQGKKKFPGLSGYSASKSAVHILTECFAAEFSDSGIRFNALALGSVQTEMFSLAFPGSEAPLQPEEMAGYIAEFALRGQKVFNGVTLPVVLRTP